MSAVRRRSAEMALEGEARGALRCVLGYALILRRADTGLLACQLGGGGRACGPRGDAVRAGVAHGWKSGWRGCRIVHGPDGEQVGGVNVCRLHVNAGSNGVGGPRNGPRDGGRGVAVCVVGDGVKRAFRGGRGYILLVRQSSRGVYVDQ